MGSVRRSLAYDSWGCRLDLYLTETFFFLTLNHIMMRFAHKVWYRKDALRVDNSLNKTRSRTTQANQVRRSAHWTWPEPQCGYLTALGLG